VELDRVAGEAVDLYANGKLIARGEVVVIEDNFGLRVTSIISPVDRLKGL
jgi:flagellar motor switch protein FliN/FliY